MIIFERTSHTWKGKQSMNIDASKIPTLWYENEAGEIFIPEPAKLDEAIPEGFIYQHTQFPYVLRHTILRAVQKKDVESCNHPEKYIIQTFGWIEGIEGRECRKCYGTQTRKQGEPWPEKWDAYGSRQIMSGESSWPEDLVLAMAMTNEYTLSQAILIAANACERCMNTLAHKYDLKWGYPEGSEEWKKTRTSCQFCQDDEKTHSR
jgi:hypothetical protein